MARVSRSRMSYVTEALLIAIEDSECGYTSEDLEYLCKLLNRAEGVPNTPHSTNRIKTKYIKCKHKNPKK